MVDLNHIFLFLALVSPIAVLARGWSSREPNHSWRIAAIVVLAITVIALIFIRHEAGYIGAGAWLAFLFLPAMGLKRTTELAAHQKYKSARRLATALVCLHPSAELREEIRALRQLEERQRTGDISPPLKWGDVKFRGERPSLREARAVTVLILLNVFIFVCEFLIGAFVVNGANTVEGLGALIPGVVLHRHEYWRLVTALFLHANSPHLIFNMFALYVLGPPFERAIGSARFLSCYLLAGISSTAGVVVLWKLGIVTDLIDTRGHVYPLEVVGASGCIMGIVGAWAAFLIRDHRDPDVRRRLANIVFIVVVQVIFDKLTPQVSMAAHICGLIGGFVIGFLVTSGPVSSRTSGRSDTSWAGRSRTG